MQGKTLAGLWIQFRMWIGTKWIGSLYFDFFTLDFLLSIAHYFRYHVKVPITEGMYNGYYMESGDVEMWVSDFAWYARIAFMMLFVIILGWMGYRATKKEIACGLIYTVIAFKDFVYDYPKNHNIGTSLVDYAILFTSLAIVHFYFAWKVNPKFYEWKK